MSIDDYRMPFGQFRGQRLVDCPVRYLDYLLGQNWVRPELKRRIAAVLEVSPEWRHLDEEYHRDDVNHLRDCVPSELSGSPDRAPVQGCYPKHYGPVDRGKPRYFS